MKIIEMIMGLLAMIVGLFFVGLAIALAAFFFAIGWNAGTEWMQ
jgi:hypothetical protein